MQKTRRGTPMRKSLELCNLSPQRGPRHGLGRKKPVLWGRHERKESINERRKWWVGRHAPAIGYRGRLAECTTRRLRAADRPRGRAACGHRDAPGVLAFTAAFRRQNE